MIYTIPESVERCSGGAPSMSSGNGKDYHPQCHCSCGQAFSIYSADVSQHHAQGHIIRYRGVVATFAERAE